MANTALPISIPAAVVPGGVTVSFAAIGIMGRVSVSNEGASQVFFVFDGVPPVAAFAPGVLALISGQAFNAANMFFTTIGLNTLGAATVQVVAFQSSGNVGEASGFL